jgi:hypothetical protein
MATASKSPFLAGCYAEPLQEPGIWRAPKSIMSAYAGEHLCLILDLSVEEFEHGCFLAMSIRHHLQNRA